MLPRVLKAQGIRATANTHDQHFTPRTNTKCSSLVPGPRLRINTQGHSQYQPSVQAPAPNADSQHQSSDVQHHSQHTDPVPAPVHEALLSQILVQRNQFRV